MIAYFTISHHNIRVTNYIFIFALLFHSLLRLSDSILQCKNTLTSRNHNILIVSHVFAPLSRVLCLFFIISLSVSFFNTPFCNKSFSKYSFLFGILIRFCFWVFCYVVGCMLLVSEICIFSRGKKQCVCVCVCVLFWSASFCMYIAYVSLLYFFGYWSDLLHYSRFDLWFGSI